jgi:hypothetical protein
LLAGRSDVEHVRKALDMFLEHWQWLEKRRKGEGTHVPPYGIAPYYFFYAHAYAAQAIEFLPESERPSYRQRFLERLFQVQDSPAAGTTGSSRAARTSDRHVDPGLVGSIAARRPPMAARDHRPMLTRPRSARFYGLVPPQNDRGRQTARNSAPATRSRSHPL